MGTEKKYCVYIHKTPTGKVYIGITMRKPEDRFKGGSGYFKNKHFYQAIKKYGWDNIEHSIVASSLTRKEAGEIEQKLIAEYDSTNPLRGYNNSIGGEFGGFGVVPSEETRKKLSEALKGKKKSEAMKAKLRGRAKSEETRKRMSEAQKHQSVETRQKISKSLTGKRHTEERRQKNSLSHKGQHSWSKGKTLTSEHKKKISETMGGGQVIQMDLQGNVIRKFDNLAHASKELGISKSHICLCCKGKEKTASGYKWAYETGNRR